MQILRFKWPMRNAVRLCAIRTLFDKCVNFINSILSLQTLAELFYANFAEIILFNCAPSLCVCARNYVHSCQSVCPRKTKNWPRFDSSMKLQLCHLGNEWLCM